MCEWCLSAFASSISVQGFTVQAHISSMLFRLLVVISICVIVEVLFAIHFTLEQRVWVWSSPATNVKIIEELLRF